MARGYPNSNQKFCDKCGTPTLTSCPNCQTEIRGYYHVPGIPGLSDYSAPAYCFKCGGTFPWTTAAIDAVQELAETVEELSSDEREELKKSLNDLVRETPRTRVAETKFKEFMKKAGKDTYDGMKSILFDVVSETVRKTIFGV